MIEVEHARLDPRELDRWAQAMARPTVLARRARRIDPEMLVSFSVLWIAAYLATFGPLNTPVETSILAMVRGAIAAAVVLCWIAAELSFRERKRAWKNGNFLYTWGWVEIRDDVLWAIPREELELTLRPAPWLLVGNMLYLRSGRWRRDVLVAPDEMAGVESVMRAPASSRMDLALEGYRDAPSRLDGSRKTTRGLRVLVRVVQLAAAGWIGSLAPFLSPPPPARIHAAAPVSEHWAAVLAATGTHASQLAISVDGCRSTLENVYLVSRLLTRSLEHPAGRAFPESTPPSSAPLPRLAAQCRWETDAVTGLFAVVVARWRIEDASGIHGEHRAYVTSSDVIAVVDDCSPFDSELRVSPLGLAEGSAALVESVVLGDVASIDRARLSLGDDARARCIRDHAARIRIWSGLTPPSGT